MFYGSFGPGPCFYECNYQRGQLFALSKWETTQDLILNHLGYSSSELGIESSGKRIFPDESISRPENRTECEAIFRQWQTKMFTQVVPEGQEQMYKLTIAMAKIALHPIAYEHIEHNRGGLMYPSVAMWMSSDNVALRPEYVDSSLQLVKVWFLYITWRGEREGRYEVVDTATLNMARVKAKIYQDKNAPETTWAEHLEGMRREAISLGYTPPPNPMLK